ncbi:unnamed protein product [Prorocentrum cordatum]|uniref:Uncharacterized protein n=1 Tax=Prorocentrum cordatum TaxID=2364126 RepID=A0ABN9SYJ2_9DINO|nr:unnamed protein product [Polarella glacialis]
MAAPRASHRVECEKGLDRVASKAPDAEILVPELDSPDGWRVMGPSRVRVTAPVRQFLEHALYDLTHGIPPGVPSPPPRGAAGVAEGTARREQMALHRVAAGRAARARGGGPWRLGSGRP